jgi:ankyrin repeat protein
VNDDTLKEVEVTAVQQAIQQDAHHVQEKIKILSLLIDKGADLDAADSTDRWTALHFAALYNADLQLVRQIVEAGADVNAVDNEHRTALHHAAKRTAISEFIRRLAAKGTQISQLCPNAPNYSQADLVAHLLANGARVDEVDVNGLTALHHAALSNLDPAIIDLLVKNGADVNAKTGSHIAPIRGSCQTDEANWTPLHLAARYNSNADVISSLITAGADVNAQTSKGETPLEFATQQEFQDAMGLLRSVGAQLTIGADESDPDEQLAALSLASNEN